MTLVLLLLLLCIDLLIRTFMRLSLNTNYLIIKIV